MDPYAEEEEYREEKPRVRLTDTDTEPSECYE